MALSPEIEARIVACEAEAQSIFDELDQMEVTLDDLSDDCIENPFPDPIEGEENSSVVRHIEALQQTVDRVRRESADPPTIPFTRSRTGG